MSHPDNPPIAPAGGVAAFAAGLRAACTSVFTYALFFTYLGIGALAHDLDFSVVWAVASTLLVFAGPAQVILLSSLGSGASPVQAAIAVGLSGIRLLPLTVSILPMLKADKTRLRSLFLPAHFLAVSLWVELLRLAPALPRADRIAFANGLGTGFMIGTIVGTVAGFYFAAKFPPLLGAGLLFLTPIMFLVSTHRNSVAISDRVAFGLGMVLAPLLAWADVGLWLLVAALCAGTAGYAVHRFKRLTP